MSNYSLEQQIEFILAATKTNFDIIDSTLTMRYVDPHWRAIYGDPAGKKCYEYFMDRSHPCPECGVARALAEDRTVVTEECLAKEGNRMIQVITTPFTDQGGERMVAEVNLDITERLRMEKDLRHSRDELEARVRERTDALAQSNESLRTLTRAIEQSPSTLVITDPIGNIQYVNPKFCQISGYFSEEVLGKNPRILKSGLLAPEVYTQLWQTITSGKEWRGEFHNKKKNGELYWVSSVIAPVRNYEGVIEHFIAVAEDITERKSTEERLQLTQFSVDRAAEPILWVGFDRRIMYVNAAACKAFGYLCNELVGMTLSDIAVTAEVQQWGSLVSQMRARGTLLIESPLRSKQGVVFPAELLLTYVMFAGHEYVCAFVRDITERKRLDQLKDDFVSTVSHELRTPLSITREGIRLLLDGVAGPVHEAHAGILRTSLENIERLARIINELLDISKIEAGKIDLHRKMTDVSGLARKVAGSFGTRLEKANLTMRLALPQEPVYAYVDADRMIQVFTNFIDNAIKFTPSGGVIVSLDDGADVVTCRIADSGIGIAAQDIPFLFEKFQQFQRAHGSGEQGTGLGLAIVKGIIEMHGGAISVRSTVGEGTEFSFTLLKKEPGQ